MRLAQFISTHLEAILTDWVSFARTRVASSHGMTELALRNDAADILTEIARDMLSPQGRDEQQAKSEGLGIRDPGLPHTPSKAHAMQRARSGFEVNQMVSEYRALRATVLRLWAQSMPEASVQDLEDVTRFNESIDEALAESLKYFVSEIDRARNLFLGVLGHDLRTPLSSIVNSAQVLAIRRPDDVKEATTILRSAQSMKALIDVVISYTRRSLGVSLPIDPVPMRLDELVHECVNEIEVANPGRTVSCCCKGDMQGHWDRARIGQLVSNLTGNALKYGDPTRPVTISVDGTLPGSIVLYVQNFGPVVDEGTLNDIFEPLVRGASAVTPVYGGGANMGLGLYIAREVVTAHAGTIRATSTAETGTQFEVLLPRSPS
jgi:signal transduction histidine kinase